MVAVATVEGVAMSRNVLVPLLVGASGCLSLLVGSALFAVGLSEADTGGNSGNAIWPCALIVAGTVSIVTALMLTGPAFESRRAGEC